MKYHRSSPLLASVLSATFAVSACGKKADTPAPPQAPAQPVEAAPKSSPDVAPSPEPTAPTPEPTAPTPDPEAAPDPEPTAPTPDPEPTPEPTAAAPQPLDGPNLASFTFGARVVSQSPTDSEPQPAWHLLDERAQTWFGGTHDQRTDVRAIVELAAPVRIDEIGVLFDVDHIHEKDLPDGLTLEVGPSPDGPWQLLTTVTPPSYLHTHLVRPEPAPTARYVRVVMPKRVADVYMGPLVGELVVRGAFTEPVPQIAPPIGSWDGGWLLPGFDLAQVGDRVLGCFRNDGTPLEATTEGRTITLRWKSPESNYVALLVPDGDQWRGLVQSFTGQDGSDAGLTRVEKTDAEPSPCILALKGDTAPKSDIEDALEKAGKAIVYSILFDFDSDRLRPESKPILDELAGILTRHPDWKLDIAGHTDSIGSDAYNLGLSERRAKSTVTALVERGIDASRLTSAGHGEGAPLVSNDTAPGRAQNRRVELTRK